jgi:transcriptional regulator with GAF, ATPase, and Fis domain
LKRIEFPATYEDGEALPFYFNLIDDQNRFAVICFKENKEIILGNLDEEYKLHLHEVQAPHEGKQSVSLIYLPLVVKQKKLGVITVQSFQQNAYSDNHLFMLRNIAIYTAIALENAESFETLNQTVVNSLDPNDKICLEGNKITPEMVGKYVHYSIHFENSGNFSISFCKDLILYKAWA